MNYRSLTPKIRKSPKDGTWIASLYIPSSPGDVWCGQHHQYCNSAEDAGTWLAAQIKIILVRRAEYREQVRSRTKESTDAEK